MMQLDFVKEKQAEPKFWFIGLHYYQLDEDCLKRVQLVVPFLHLAITSDA